MRDGLNDTSMDAVAKRAGVSKATLYVYFASKDVLFAAVMKRERERFGLTIGAITVRSDADIETTLTDVGTRFLKYVISPSAVTFFRVTVSESLRFPDLAKTVMGAGREELIGCVEAILARAAAAGVLELDDPRRAAGQFLSLVKSDLHMNCLVDPAYRPPTDAIARQVQESVEFFMFRYRRR